MLKIKTKIFILVLIAFLLSFCAGKKDIKKEPAYMRYYNMGAAYMNAGDIVRAERYYKMSIEKKPDFYLSHYGLGVVYTYEKKFSLAKEEFKKVLQLNPSFLEPYNYLGIIYKEEGKIEKAKEMFLKIANSSEYPTRENGFYNIALIEYEAKKYLDAYEYVEMALKANPTFAPAFNLKGKILLKLKKDDEAGKSFYKAVKLVPNSALFNYDYAVYLYTHGFKIEARRFFVKASALSKNETLRKLAKNYIKLIDEAI